MYAQAILRWLAVQHDDAKRIIAAVSHILSVWDRYTRTRGTKWACATFKSARNHCTRYMCGDPLTTSQGISITKDGLPNLLGGFGKAIFREGSKREMAILLTVLSIGKLVPGDKIGETSPITAPWEGFLPQDLMNWVREYLSHKKWEVKWDRPHWTTKAGPKGQAMATAMADLASLPQDLREMIKLLGGPVLSDYMYNLMDQIYVIGAPGKKDWQCPSIRRLHFIQDKEMKSRAIAILDYWSQTCLKPYHDKLMSWLKDQPGDFTYQGDVARWLANGTGPYHSYDLSNATDRFPLAFQKVVFGLLFGEDKAEAWAHILVHHPYEVTSTGESVSYATGQPMGAYSSWAMFTMCHHLILKYVKSVHPDTTYAVLGDDVVIRGEKGPDLYKEVMTQLGVQISPTKSHVSSDTFEFAKRWFKSGVEVTPFPLNQAVEAQTDIVMMSRLFLDLPSKGWYLGGNGLSRSILEYLKAVGCPGGLASYLARRSVRFIFFQRWVLTQDPSLLDHLVPKVVTSSQSSCFHKKRLEVCLKLGVGKAVAGELGTILENIKTVANRRDIQGLVDQATDSAAYADISPGELCLGIITLDLRKKASAYDAPMHALAKMNILPDWSTTLGEASVSLLKAIPVGRIPDPDKYMSERAAVTATRNLLRVFHKTELLTSQFFALRPASAQSEAKTSQDLRRVVLELG